MKRRFAALVTLLLSLTSVARAQEPQPDPLVKLGESAGRQVQVLIDSAQQAGLPWQLVRLKAIEGVNKKYDSKRIVAGVREYYKSLVIARAALGPLASPQDLEAGVVLLTSRVSAEDLALFRVTRANRSPVQVLTYVNDLISQRNVPPREAIDAFTKLWKDGAAEGDLDGLWRDIDRDILSGVPPKAALHNRVRSLPPRKPPAEQDE